MAGASQVIRVEVVNLLTHFSAVKRCDAPLFAFVPCGHDHKTFCQAFACARAISARLAFLLAERAPIVIGSAELQSDESVSISAARASRKPSAIGRRAA
jgi:hypothetical protein